MAFNAAETARAGRIIQAWVTDEADVPVAVRDVALLAFPGAAAVADFIPGLLFEKGDDRRWVALALKPPWTAIHFTEPRQLRNVDEAQRLWSQTIKSPYPWEVFRHTLLKQHVKTVDVEPGDRVLRLHFTGDLILAVELFGSRPNLILSQAGVELFRWRESKGTVRGPQAAGAGASVTADDSGADLTDEQWFQRHYEKGAKDRAIIATQRLLQAALNAQKQDIKDAESLLERLEGALEESQHAAQSRTEGDEIKARLYELSAKARAEASSQMAKLYAKAKKLERTALDVKPRREALQEKLTSLRATLFSLLRIDASKPFAEVAEAIQRLRPALPDKPAARQRPAEKKAQAQGLRRYISKEGFSLWVGRNHSENEEIVMKLARGNDLWFHLKGRPGAHVIVQLPSKKTASLETLLDAATLAAHYSGIKDGEKAEIDYTPRKNIKRRAGGGASRDGQFLVNYTGAKTLMVKVDPERVKRLMGSGDFT
jgi:predicted ribosome quality control (RQC) complex YloA/Tae2 family protein